MVLLVLWKMITRRTLSRRVEEIEMKEEIPPQVEQVEHVEKVPQGYQVPIVGGGDDGPGVPPKLTNGEIREALITLARALTTHVNIVIAPRLNVLESTMTSRLRYFVWMDPPIFFCSKVGEDP